MVCCWLCCPSSSSSKTSSSDAKGEHLLDTTTTTEQQNDDAQDFIDLQHLATKRQIKVTVKRGTQAGIVAGLSVMTGVIVAGPVGAVAGGALGTAVAATLAKDTVSLHQLLAQTPAAERAQVLHLFRESFREEFTETIQSNPELKLLLGGATILGIMRYAVDRQMLKNEQLERVDGILRKVC